MHFYLVLPLLKRRGILEQKKNPVQTGKVP